MANIAKATWTPAPQEEKALLSRHYLNDIEYVDQIWPWLSNKYPKVIALDAPHAFHPEAFTYKELNELIENAANSFLAMGIQTGDVVALFGENSPRWLIADQGLMRVGASDAVRGSSAPVEELHYILDDCHAVALIVQNADLLNSLSLSQEQLSRLKVILQLEGDVEKGAMDWSQFIHLGQRYESKLLNSSQKRGKLDSSAIATIIYTSGTTGRPKGVPLSHGNLLHQMKSLACVAHPPAGSPVLSVLPIWHAYERSAEYYFFSCGCSQSYTTIKHLKEDMARVCPVVMATVPRLWEAIQVGFEDVIAKMPIPRRVLLKQALSNSCEYKASLRRVKGLLIQELSMASRVLALFDACFRWPVHFLSSKLLWPKVVRRISGGQLRYPINGGGAIAPHVDSFFEGLGIDLLVGYGLTETSPVVSCRRPWQNFRGSSGPPLPQTEFQIVDPLSGQPKMFKERGRVLVRGPQVMNGYLNRPDATSKVLDEEGWFDTGDIGMLMPNGELVLTGRAKDTIVLSNGENIEPGPLEEALLASPLIEQVMLVGQDEKSLGALLVPHIEFMLAWAREKGLTLPLDFEKSPGYKDLRFLLKKEVNNLLANRKSSRLDERVRGVVLTKPFSIENGLLTQTLKQKREQIVRRDIKLIDLIYDR